MSLRKLLALSATGLAFMGASSTFAGGIEVPPAPIFSGVYLEGNVGYVNRDWRHVAGSEFDPFVFPFDFDHQNRGGYTAIVDLGYEFNEFVSAELGWIDLPNVHNSFATTFLIDDAATLFTTRLSTTSWAAYIAAKLTIPIYEDLYLFGKLGAAYVNNQATLVATLGDLTGTLNTHSDYWTPMFAFGAQYYFTPNVSVNFQYTRIPGYHRTSFSTNRFVVPNSDLFTLGVGYKFLT